MTESDDIGAFVPGPRVRIAGRTGGPLAGLSFAAKDLFDVAGVPTGGGNHDWPTGRPIPAKHSWAVQTLLDGGATLIGKTVTDEVWQEDLDLKLFAAIRFSRLVWPGMKASKWGRIINIASTHGLVASAHKVAYVAAKHGIVGLTKVVGMECADTGVTCNAICPGWVLTPLVQAQIEARAREQGIAVEQARRNLLAEKQPQLQFTTTEQIAGLALFLASDTASNMQGTQLVSDGGWTAQ